MRSKEIFRTIETVAPAMGLFLLAFLAFPTRLRRKWFWKEFDGECQHCGKRWDDGWLMEFDHIIPQSRGGKNTLDNAQLLCLECHRDKHLRDGDVWAAEMIQRRLDKTGGRR